jgi:hypothetical protein
MSDRCVPNYFAKFDSHIHHACLKRAQLAMPHHDWLIPRICNNVNEHHHYFSFAVPQTVVIIAEKHLSVDFTPGSAFV